MDAKLKNLPAEALEDLWRFRYPEEGGTKLSYEEILVEIPLRYGITSSLGALSEFYSWLRLRKRMEHAAHRAEQVKIELAKDSTITPEDLERVAQTVFTSEALEDGNIKAFVALAKLRISQRQIQQDERRLAILEAKAKAMDEAKDVLGTKMSAEEQNRRLREILK